MNSATELITGYKELSAKPESEEIDLYEYWRIVNRYKWSIVALTFVVSVAAVVVVLSLTPIFGATATLLIESEEVNVVSIEEVYGVDSSKREYYQTQFQILSSRKIAERVIDELDIQNHPEYDPSVDRGFSLGSLIGSVLSLLTPPAEDAEPPTADQIRQNIVRAFMGNLTIQPLRNTQLVNINFESADPELAYLVPNALGNAYINSDLEARLELTRRASSWLTDRLAGMRDDLEASERALREYQERENLVDVKGVITITANEIEEQTRRLVTTRKAADAARAQSEAAGDIDGPYNQSWETLPAVLADSLSQDLKSVEAESEKNFNQLTKRYGPKHPKYIAAQTKLASSQRAFQARVRQIVSGFEDVYKQAVSDQSAIERALASSKQEIQEINRKSYELSQLQRAADTNKQLYDMFFQRFQETNQTDFDAANARFIDEATRPYAPVKPRKKLLVALAGATALIVGFLLAFLRAALDNTIRVAEELEEKLGQPVLGVLPFEKQALDAGMVQLYFDSSFNAFAEAVRSIRTSVVLSGLEKPHKITVVTSSLPGEGKTTISSNLALALGQMEKVVLVDADMRRPSLANEYGLSKSLPGLSELVAGTARAEECIQRIEQANIDLITAGSVPPNPLDLLSSRRFEELLKRLSEKYDRIVIDSAPTQAVSDSMVLSTKADALIYVVKSDATPVNVAKNGVERLIRVGAPIIGAVLNQFDVQAEAKYGYGGYGRYGYYQYGYSSDGQVQS